MAFGNVEEFLEYLLDMFNLNHDFGMILIVAIVMVAVSIFLAVIKADFNLILYANIMLVIFFAFTGLIPMWSIILVAILLVGLLILRLTGGKGGSGDD